MVAHVFLPEALRISPLTWSTTKMVDCWMGPLDLCWYLAMLSKELWGGVGGIREALLSLDSCNGKETLCSSRH